MNFSSMLNMIDQKYDIKVIKLESKAKVESIMLTSEDMKEWRPDTLYIGHSKHLPKNRPEAIQAIVFGDIGEAVLESASNIAVIHEKDLSSVFNQLSSMFYQSLRIASIFSKLVAMLMRGENVSAIMNEAASQLNNPIIAIDLNYHVLSYSTNYPITDALWNKNIKRGYCTYEFIVAVNEIISNQDTPEDSDSFTVNCPASPKSKLCSKIIWNNQVVGYTIMLEEDTPLQEFHKELLPKISYIVADILSKSPEFESIQGSNSELILSHILNGEDELNIKARMEAAKLIFPEQMRCIVIGSKPHHDIRQKTDKKYLLRYHKEKLIATFPHSYATYYKDNIIFIINTDGEKQLSKEQEEKLKELFSNDIITIGISQSFQSIFLLKHYFHQCLNLQEIAQQLKITKQLMYYEHYLFENLLIHTQDKQQLFEYIHPSLSILREYDSTNASYLYETLRVYLECKYNLKQTSLQLFIHRNSLTYRMEKITQLTNLNLEDSNTLFWLEMSYRADKFLLPRG